LADGEGLRFDDGKARFDLLPPGPLFEVARVATKGMQKYAARNWEGGTSWSRTFAPIIRHCMKWLGGERLDEETGCHHLAHAAWGCLALMQFEVSYPELDDRSKLRFQIGFDTTEPQQGVNE